MLHKYIETKGGKNLLTEYENYGFLNKSSKKSMVQLVTSYLIDTYTLHPKHEEIIYVCSAAIELFPVYKITPSNVGGIVNIPSFYDFFLIGIF